MLATDTLVEAEAPRLPYSMYLVGLAKAWVFEAPFATLLIATDSFREDKGEQSEAEAFGCDNLEFLVCPLTETRGMHEVLSHTTQMCFQNQKTVALHFEIRGNSNKVKRVKHAVKPSIN
jgi:hypothetical protein